MTAYYITVAALFGLCAGSFLNVVIYRVPEGLSLIKPGSFCPDCGKPIKNIHLIPVFSWLFLRGKCAYCGQKISPRYICVELLTGILFVLAMWKFGDWRTVPVCFLICVLIATALIDLDEQYIYDKILLFGLPIAIVPLDPINSLLGAVVGFGILFLINLGCKIAVKKDGFGQGDMFLCGLLGLYFGWLGVLQTLWLAVILAGLFAAAAMVAKRLKRGEYFAFAPFVCLAAIVMIFYLQI